MNSIHPSQKRRWTLLPPARCRATYRKSPMDLSDSVSRRCNITQTFPIGKENQSFSSALRCASVGRRGLALLISCEFSAVTLHGFYQLTVYQLPQPASTVFERTHNDAARFAFCCMSTVVCISVCSTLDSTMYLSLLVKKVA